MYRAKAEGKNRYVVFDQEMHQQALQRLEVETELRQGLERDELRLYLQPILSLPTLKLVGFETLVRWQHPKKGLLCPGHFLPVAEETGLILALDQRMIQMASEQMQQWRETNLADGLTLSINLSGRQVGHPGLTALIGRWAFYGTQDPSWLKLEITETLIMEDDDGIRETLWHLRDMGICLSIDDFGTGYSSLSRLHHYPIDTLKIDGSFVRRIGPNGEHMAMVQSIVGLAHSLGMEVVAEGVETEQHLQHLQQIRCEYGQGYYFARPLDPAAATQFIQLHQAGFKTGVVLH
jgi:EAL domain-containing protein (putative c-di-GMP-specific phosphodiesterase class I)